MPRLSQLLAVAVMAAMPAVSYAQTVTFEGTGNGASIPNGYAGLNWSNFQTLNGTTYIPSGYQNGRVSGDMVAYNAFGDPAAVLQGATPFTLNSGYFTAAWSNGLVLNVTGYVGGVATFFQTALLNTSAPELLTFDWENLDQVVFESTGGVDDPRYALMGDQFVLDNLSVNLPVTSTPEPASLFLLASGLVGLAGATRRRANAGGK